MVPSLFIVNTNYTTSRCVFLHVLYNSYALALLTFTLLPLSLSAVSHAFFLSFTLTFIRPISFFVPFARYPLHSDLPVSLFSPLCPLSSAAPYLRELAFCRPNHRSSARSALMLLFVWSSQ